MVTVTCSPKKHQEIYAAVHEHFAVSIVVGFFSAYSLEFHACCAFVFHWLEVQASYLGSDNYLPLPLCRVSSLAVQKEMWCGQGLV